MSTRTGETVMSDALSRSWSAERTESLAGELRDRLGFGEGTRSCGVRIGVARRLTGRRR